MDATNIVEKKPGSPSKLGKQLLKLIRDNPKDIDIDINTVKGLIRNGADVNIKDPESNSPLFLAAQKGKTEVVNELILSPHLLVNQTNALKKGGRTALIEAAFLGHISVVNALLCVPGIDVNAMDRYGDTALMKAALYNKSLDVTQALLRSPNIEVNQGDRFGQTVLMKVAGCTWNKQAPNAICELLKVPGILINTSDFLGITALMQAATVGNVYAVTTLLKDVRIDATLASRGGETALSIASRKGHTQIIILLKNEETYVEEIAEEEQKEKSNAEKSTWYESLKNTLLEKLTPKSINTLDKDEDLVLSETPISVTYAYLPPSSKEEKKPDPEQSKKKKKSYFNYER